MRTIEEITIEMEAEQANRPELSGLQDLNANTSAVSYFALLKKMMAAFIQLLEASWEVFREEVTQQIANTRVGSTTWYKDQILSFQLGDQIEVVDGRVTYVKLDDNKKILKQVAVVETPSGRLSVRVAKANNAPLNETELKALTSYVGLVKFAGVLTDVISVAPDEVKLVATVKVDRQLIDQNGQAVAGGTYPVFDALDGYLRALPVDAIVVNSLLVDQAQAVPGVKDVQISSSQIRRPGGTWVDYTRETESTAGHAILHPDTVINYAY